MPSPLRVLILEDNPDDAEFMVHELRRAELDVEWERVEDEEGFRAKLALCPDVVLSDFSLPGFNALRALEIYRELGPDSPFIVVSGAIGEEQAVECLRLGADDYLLKDRIARLGQSVIRLLEEKRLCKEKAQAEDDLRASEFRYRNLFESSMDTVFFTAPDGTLLSLNEAGLDLFGLDPSDLGNVKAADLWVDTEESDEFQRKLAESEMLSEYELRLRKKDGTEMICLEAASVVRGEDGQVIGYQGIIRDITARRQAEEALKASEERFRDISYSMADWIWEVDAHGRYTFVAGRVKEILGYHPDEVIGKTTFDFMPLQEARRIGETFASIAEKKAPIKEMENWNLTKDGRLVCFLTSGVPILNERGELLGYRGVNKDVTEERKAQKELAESEGRFRRMAEHSPDIIYRYGLLPEPTFSYISPAVEGITGYTPADFYNRRELAFEIIHPEDRPILEKLFQEREVSSDPMTLRCVHRDGTPLWLEMRNVALRNSEGWIVDIEGIARDVTARVQMEAEQREAERLSVMGQVMAGLAHDFKNILTVVEATAEILSSSLEPEQVELRADAEELRSVALQGTTLVRKLLSVGRTEEIKPESVQLQKSVQKFSSTLRHFLPAHIQIDVDQGDDLPSALADIGSLEQILLNLATNAKDAMPSGGTLRIRMSHRKYDDDDRAVHPGIRAGEFVCMAVSDTGAGMDKETQRQVFDPFFTTKGATKGSGLGLPVVRRMVEGQGGFVTLYSEPGRGTTVRVYFPVAEDQKAEGSRRPAGVEGEVEGEGEVEVIPAGDGETILMAEDDPALRRATRRTLEKLGYNVLVACDGEEALRLFEERGSEVALILTDVVMPKLGGPGLYRELQRRGESVKMLFSSGHGSDEVEELDFVSEGLPFVEKPWAVGDMARAIRKVLRAPARTTGDDVGLKQERTGGDDFHV